MSQEKTNSMSQNQFETRAQTKQNVMPSKHEEREQASDDKKARARLMTANQREAERLRLTDRPDNGEDEDGGAGGHECVIDAPQHDLGGQLRFRCSVSAAFNSTREKRRGSGQFRSCMACRGVG